MKLVVQRVLQAEVQVDGQSIGKINRGLLVFVGVGKEDTKEIADKYLKKLLGLRIFEDENGKTNLSLKDVDIILGEMDFLLLISTLDESNWSKSSMVTSSSGATALAISSMPPFLFLSTRKVLSFLSFLLRSSTAISTTGSIRSALASPLMNEPTFTTVVSHL